MRPTLFDLSLFGHGFAIDTRGVFVSIGALAGLLLAVRLDRGRDELRDLGLELILFGLLGARLAYVALHLGTFVASCRDAIGTEDIPIAACTRGLWLWEGGLHLYGGLIAAFAWLAWRARQRGLAFFALADCFAAGLAVAIAIARIGCFLAGCCFGTVTTGRFGVRFADDSVAYQALTDLGVISPFSGTTPPLHPVQLYGAVGHAVLALALIVYGRKLGVRHHGQLFAALLCGHLLMRILLAPFSASA